ncbi:MAG: hypothetical protein UX37_C0017G0025 [Microgenomates group bacterium GW2011_GWA2_46_16]|nr:MAG: hypothetical protein UX37_C0017G0025 [Microgenomates group bacterium GW2011_GWA2_46_16]
MTLPKIDINSITSLDEAKNVIELLLGIQRQQQKRISILESEIAKLKGQPKRPLFPQSKQSSSVTRLLKEAKPWSKTSKKNTLEIDKEECLEEIATCTCGCTSFTTLRTTRKIVQGLSLKKDTVSYKGRIKKCRGCGKQYRSLIPLSIAGRTFSKELSSLLSYFVYGCRMTQPLILRMLCGMGIQISSGQISNLLMENGDILQKADHHLRTEGIAESPHLQSDASGAKRKDKITGKIKNQHVQVISNKILSIFSITPKYNAQTLSRLLTKDGRKKLFVSDDSSTNGDRLSQGRQLCFVHEIRHYQKLFPFFTKHHDIQQQILSQWQHFYHLSKHYGESPPVQRGQKKAEIQALFNQITSQVTGYDLLDNQLRLTQKKKTRLLLFLDHPQLPIHNNQCEQDLRQFVIMRKITGGTKSVAGDKSLARHLSVIQTAQKRGLDVLSTLHGLLTETLSPAVLTATI